MSLLARRLPLALSVLLALATVGSASSAEARVSGEVTYSYDQTWQAAIRLVRVDLGCPITDRDEEIGFVLFEYRNAGRAYPGSLEVVRSTDERGTEHQRKEVAARTERRPCAGPLGDRLGGRDEQHACVALELRA